MQAKKSLGQNFLTSQSIVEKIVNAGNIVPSDTILEVGPGKGILTASLLAKAMKVIAVEKDDRLIPYLEEKFAQEISEGRLQLVHADILEFEPKSYKLKPKNYKLIANIPYYITGQLIREFLSGDVQPSEIVLLVQKEVAERVVAKKEKPLDSSGGKESILSISVKAYGTPHYIATVKAGSFSPAPSVDSAVLSIKNISKDFFTDIREELFFETVRQGFSGKRKQLKNNLKKLCTKLNLKAQPEQILMNADIHLNIRAEELPLTKWKKIVEELGKAR